MIFYPIQECWECNDGWNSHIEELIEKLTVLCEDQIVHITQIKEKFGGLCVYIDFATEEVYNLIHSYEHKAYEICEICGNVGTWHGDLSWKQTLCKKHYKEILTQQRKYWGFWEWKNHILRIIINSFRKIYAKQKKK
jgi:hypothetical protein